MVHYFIRRVLCNHPVRPFLRGPSKKNYVPLLLGGEASGSGSEASGSGGEASGSGSGGNDGSGNGSSNENSGRNMKRSRNMEDSFVSYLHE